MSWIAGLRHPLVRLLAVISATVVVAALLSDDGNDDAPRAGETVAEASLKPRLRGLVEQFDPEIVNDASPIHAYAVGVTWAELQPEPGGPILENNAIDVAIAHIRANGNTRIRLKVRAFAGIHAPEWTKRLGGQPFHITERSSGREGLVGRFWTPEFGDAYQQLQRALADRYDDEPEIASVAVSRCTTIFAEPFLRQISLKGAADQYRAAGYTAAADRRCHREEIDAHRVWRKTRSGLALNPYQYIGEEGPGAVDGEFTEEMMLYCRQVLGPRCVLENNSIRWPPPRKRYTAMYDAMKRLGGPIALQTAAASRIGDPVQTVLWAVEFGADAVELGARSRAYTRAELVDLNDRLLRS